MKKVAWLLLALGVALSVVGCNKRSDESVEDTISIENATSKNDLLFPIQPHGQIDWQGVSFVLSFAENEMKNDPVDMAVKEVVAVLSHYGFILHEVSDDYKTIILRQDITTPRGEVLTYQLVYVYDEEFKLFDIFSCELINYENNLIRELSEPQYHGEVITSNDERNEQMIKVFETYLLNEDKTFTPYTNRKNFNLNILDYVKVNLTNSNYDEYLLFISTNIELDSYIDEIELTNVDVIKHFIVDKEKIIKVYNLPDFDIAAIYKYGTYHGRVNFIIDLRFPSHEVRYEKDGSYEESSGRFYDDYRDAEFGKRFQYGYISDFNQNGTNELYLSSSYGNYYVIEFDGEGFFRNVLIDKSQAYPFEWWRETYLYGYDWAKYELYLRHDMKDIYDITVQWIPEDNCFRLIKYKIQN